MKFPLRRYAVIALGLGLWAIAQGFATAQDLTPGSGPESKSISPANPINTVMIPGPLRSFLRMAGVSQEVNSSDVLPMVARNVFLHGFDNGKETEFLVLLDRYLQMSRALQSMASGDGVIRVGNCAAAAPLVQALGYRFENGCGANGATLVTEDSERAFLAVDSGFPITKLEESLQRGQEFAYPFPATMVPVLYDPNEWIQLSTWRDKQRGNLLDVLLHDESLDRLYSAMARLEPGTSDELHRSPGLRRLLPYGPILDFYAGQFSISNHVVNVPGGPAAESEWQALAGVSPHSPGEFLVRMAARDRGWLAAYYDAVARISPEEQMALMNDGRLRSLYDAYRSTGINAGAGSGVFPRNAELMLLLSRIPWDAKGQPDVPGGLQAWQQILAREIKVSNNREWARHAQSVTSNEQFLEAIVAATNLVREDGPTQMYLTLSAIDSQRAPGQKLSTDTVNLLAARYTDYRNWYIVFTDFPQIDDSSIAQFVKVADHIAAVNTPALRANALGAFQADLGLWQIFARQKQIPADKLNASWRGVLDPFANVDSSNALFEAARNSLNAATAAAGGSSNFTEDSLVDLLAGPAQRSADSARVHEELARRMHAVLDDQRLASLDTLFGLYDGMEAAAKGSTDAASLLPLAENLHDFEMPRPIFTEGERVAWSPLIYTSRHAELQVQTDLAKILRSKPTPQQLELARSRLAPFLRDTLVGMNYAYYEPPGAQVLHNNPLFVRSHDFAVASVQGIERIWGTPELIGVGATAGGGAYLMGSLADLPYALATTEEDFIAPEKVQALIWRETVPQLLVESVIPRWWNVDKNEMHATALYQRAGEELLSAAQENAQLRGKVVAILAERFTPTRLEAAEESLNHPNSRDPLTAQMLPSDLYFLAAQFRTRYPNESSQWGAASKELSDIAQKDSASCDPARIAMDFGVPHPAFTETDTGSLLSREPFPVSGGYSSRLFGESWESSNLYWARLADEMGYSPVMLNLLVPELTRHMVANIFATYVDDWPALLRALRQTGDEFRKGKFAVQSASRDGMTSDVTVGSASE
jgi:hypothetical protein